MEMKKEIKLAEQILKLDRLRDELYEELLITLGANAHEFLRSLQNYKLRWSVVMSNQLRAAIEKAKKYYIKKIIAAGLYDSDRELSHLTLSELERIYQNQSDKV